MCGVNAAPEIGFVVEKSAVDSPTKQMFEGDGHYAMGAAEKRARLSAVPDYLQSGFLLIPIPISRMRASEVR